MINPLLKKILPHIIAIVVFLIVSIIFCKPVLDGNVLNQHDNVGWKGMAQNSFEYKDKNGHFPLWNPNLFSGMPNYQVAMEGKSVMPDLTKIFSLGLPKPIICAFDVFRFAHKIVIGFIGKKLRNPALPKTVNTMLIGFLSVVIAGGMQRHVRIANVMAHIACELEDTPSVRGMVNKISHLVTIVEERG